MKLTELLAVEDIVDLTATGKPAALSEMVRRLAETRPGLDEEEILRTLLEREALGGTGTGSGVAIPHCRTDSVSDLLVCFGRSRQGVDFDSLDGKPAHFLFMLVAPARSAGSHLSVLARISNLLHRGEVRDLLLLAPDAKSILGIIAAHEERPGAGG